MRWLVVGAVLGVLGFWQYRWLGRTELHDPLDAPFYLPPSGEQPALHQEG